MGGPHGGERMLFRSSGYARHHNTILPRKFEGKRYDAGNKLELLQANVEYALRDPSLKDGFREYLLKLSKEL